VPVIKPAQIQQQKQYIYTERNTKQDKKQHCSKKQYEKVLGQNPYTLKNIDKLIQ
jgi:hypothetical protein